MPDLKNELSPEIRDQHELIEDGMTDEMQALEELAADEEKRRAKALAKTPADDVEPAPETL